MAAFTIRDVVTFRAVDALNAKRAFVTVQTVQAVLTAIDTVRVVAVFVMIANENHIAVAVLLSAVGIVAVFVS